MDRLNTNIRLSRRKLIAGLGALAAGSVFSAPLAFAKSLNQSNYHHVKVPLGELFVTNGTVGLVAQETYPNPFANIPPADPLGGKLCQITQPAILGPCHIESPMRQDISEGQEGIPVRMMLRIVNTRCIPESNAIVEIWHTRHDGRYSGDIHEFCSPDRTTSCFRGYQRTDENGIVTFDTCLPGWYSGRTIHVHVRILVEPEYEGEYDNKRASHVTQLVWSDRLIKEIYDKIPLYNYRGNPDTWNYNDTEFKLAGGVSNAHILKAQQMVDGSMFAYTTIAGPFAYATPDILDKLLLQS
jgi:protocatechuate 3,4-dioxygenase beta subunit